MSKTFPGGIHPSEHKKRSKKEQIRKAADPKIAVIPLCQHIGTPAEPLVNVGDIVKIGQPLGDSERYVSAAVHASIGGKIIAIEPRLTPFGAKVLSVVIENNGDQDVHPSVRPYPNFKDLSKTDIRKIIRGAGIVGLGGAAFPTRVKLQPPPDKVIKTIIINGAECEPYLTCDYRLLIEQPKKVILGLKAIMKPTDALEGIIAIEDNKPEAITAIQKAIDEEVSHHNLRVAVLKTKYPQGAEKQLIKAITKREVPSGGLPADVHCIVNNVGTAVAIAKALTTGMPLIERIVTVTGGSISEPSNLLVRIGTPFSELVEQCGGFLEEPTKIIMGGPLMGISVPSIDVPVIKATSGILVPSKKELDDLEPEPCIRCAKCVDSCPQYLLPNLLGDASENDRFDLSKSYGALDCIECGVCSYVCPAKRNLVQLIKLSKNELLRKK
ncbi:MAG: electron transport complex subunit RsxC [Candidatus Margulisbacteria bacterium]|nr:electron transport complex subunit RsxC [Candidatus Margulisiibacteriota bacterium]MBU1022395.1 electron transport complex subunit RsxC [Candidatus Margulisiibacteriota bacterium]MBU1729053.1 electron transport complex subunit RsxC [Candidatus Margulisiibacteriota bacterium]MBU1954526.1 electron transport complex subunit RsxC [Candidatus Margulisiibacteriota bacterium]